MGRVVIPGFRKIETSGGGEGGTSNYNDLTNKPFINNVPLVGNLKTVDLKLTDSTLTEEGVPAESKTVGTKLEEQSTSLTAVKEELTKKANISDIPTKVSELQNDSNYQTDTDVTTTLTTYATKTYVGEQISSADHLKREIVTEIPSPETADKNTIYMLKIESATGEDKYKEYLLIDGTVQCIGDTSVDLTDYAKKTEIPTELPANGGNSLTVNGHTVNSDVPENAVFTDTVYDDTEVKEEIVSINSNLDTLEFGEVAGGENLFVAKYDGYYASDGKINNNGINSTTYECSDIIKFNGSNIYISTDKAYTSLSDGKGAWVGIVCFDSNKNFISESYLSIYMESSLKHCYTLPNGVCYIAMSSMKGVNVCFSEKEIDYTPYIPSVNMLANEVDAQNESLEQQGLLDKFDNQLEQGYYQTQDGQKIYHENFVRSANVFSCKSNDVIYLESNIVVTSAMIIYFKGNQFVSYSEDVLYGTSKGKAIVPNNVDGFVFHIYKDGGITPSEVSIKLYINNQIEQIKNDLGGLSFSVSGTTLSITDGTNTWTLSQ